MRLRIIHVVFKENISKNCNFLPTYTQTYVYILKDPDEEIAITSETSFLVELEKGNGKTMILLGKKNNSQFV